MRTFATRAPQRWRLQRIFYMLSGTTMITGVLISMRLIAEEKMNGTIELLFTSPISEAQLVVGKFLRRCFF
jgi:ABC-2 type transport system permease protein